MLQNKKNENQNIYGGIIVSLALIFPSLNNFMKSISEVLSLPTQFLSLLIYILYVLVYIYCVKKSGFRFVSRIIKFLLIYIAILSVSYLNFEHTRIFYQEYILNIRQILIIYIPAMAAVSYIDEWNYFFHRMKLFSFLGIIISIISNVISNYIDYMAFSIQLLPMVCIFFYFFMKEKRIIDFIFFIVSFTSVFLAGNRMSLFSIILYMVFFVVINTIDFKKKSTWVILPTLLILVIVVYVNWTNILFFLDYILASFSIESRTIEKLINNEATELGFREIMYDKAFEILSINNYKATGIFSDRYYLRAFWPSVVYVHNVILEFLFSFGILGTIIASIFIMFKSFNLLNKTNKEFKNIYIFMFSIIMPRLMISGSFVIEGFFFLFLGLLSTSKIKRSKEIKKHN